MEKKYALLFISIIFFIINSIFNAIAQNDLIYPSDFEYLGAFKVPNDHVWGGTLGMTYYPGGEPNGPDDGFTGSLYIVGASSKGMSNATEINIPVPIISNDKDVDDLNRAETLQGHVDITDGRQPPGSTLTTPILADVQYLPKQGGQSSDKLYWVMYEYYTPPADLLTLGWCELDLSNLNSEGVWRFGDNSCTATSRYMFEIPKNWADAYFEGNYLAAGRFRASSGGSWGPALFASAPWKNGNPPSNGTLVDTIKLMFYDKETHFRNDAGGDVWNDGAWLTIGSRTAVMIAGKKGYRHRANGFETYGQPQPDDYSRNKGYHSSPWYAQIIFYDPQLYTEVVNGNLDPGEIQPYAYLNAHDVMFNSDKDLPTALRPGRTTGFAGVGYDRERNILYFMEPGVEGYYSPSPIVHVFRLSESTLAPDTEPPSAPQNLRAENVDYNKVELSWDASTDNRHISSYIIFRNGWPIDPSVETSYVDERINPNGLYNYTVIAVDSSDLSSEHSQPLTVSTPDGEDNQIPLITDVHVTDITEDSAIINWHTDELSTSKVEYRIEYSGDPIVTVTDFTLTRDHRVELTDLPGLSSIQRFEVHFYSNDTSGNENRYYEINFATSREGRDNSEPLLNGIGAKRVSAGSVLSFEIEAHDSDRLDTLTFSVAGMPSGASFNPATREFYWVPDTGDIGIHRMTFSVSDGDQSDSEEVPIIVEAASQNCDNDDDGFISVFCGGDDCNDDNASINPDAIEIYGNGIDEDCDGSDSPISTCSSGADNDPIDSSVSIDELISFIEDWKTGSLTIDRVLEAIGEWKDGC